MWVWQLKKHTPVQKCHMLSSPQVSQLEGVYSVHEPHFWTLCSDVYVGAIKVEVAKDADVRYIQSSTHNIFTAVSRCPLFCCWCYFFSLFCSVFYRKMDSWSSVSVGIFVLVVYWHWLVLLRVSGGREAAVCPNWPSKHLILSISRNRFLVQLSWLLLLRLWGVSRVVIK